ncbi:MAG: hypothetical protein O8C61_12315 [Candidatus Methanoperedens sp.]|nr:hypothetical protein [Candidatus Methanoperedens sp.]
MSELVGFFNNHSIKSAFICVYLRFVIFDTNEALCEYLMLLGCILFDCIGMWCMGGCAGVCGAPV